MRFFLKDMNFPGFYFYTYDGELTMFKTDLKEVVSPVGCLKLVSTEKCGVEIRKKGYRAAKK